MEPDQSHQPLRVLDHVRPRRPARQVLLIPVGRTIRDDKTDDDAFEEEDFRLGFPARRGRTWLDAPNTVIITLETPRSICMRNEAAVTPTHHASSIIIRGKPRISHTCGEEGVQ
jgi:hypothetical protein